MNNVIDIWATGGPHFPTHWVHKTAGNFLGWAHKSCASYDRPISYDANHYVRLTRWKSHNYTPCDDGNGCTSKIGQRRTQRKKPELPKWLGSDVIAPRRFSRVRVFRGVAGIVGVACHHDPLGPDALRPNPWRNRGSPVRASFYSPSIVGNRTKKRRRAAA